MFRFTEDCLTGIEEIDEEHRYLFELMNAIIQLLNNDGIEDKYNQIKAVLEDLENYADNHFVHEEAYMESIDDPELPVQKRQHIEFGVKISELDVSNIDNDSSQQEMLREMMIYLTRWLYRHILSSDLMIGKMKSLKNMTEDGNACAFTDKYRTGVVFIDTEHKNLFRIIGEANNLIKAELLHDKFDEIVGILEELKIYTKEHFGDEEEYMERIQYSRIDAQKRAHGIFIAKLEEIDLDEVDDNQQQYLEELIDFLFSWLANHILVSDKLIGEETREKNIQ